MEFTRLCIRALLRHTRRPWELIVVDNGSTDDTTAYLRGVQDAAPVPVTVIRNARNFGFPRAINQGLREARGEYIVLLNNDAVVTDDWLEQLIGLADSDVGLDADWLPAVACPSPPPTSPSQGGERVCSPANGQSEVIENGTVPPRPARGTGAPIGLVGPMSNYATPPQLVADVPYRDLDGMHAFARRWRDQNRGKWLTARKLSGFCLLMKRAVYEVIGGLDERFGLGLFDDDDLAEPARRAGFGMAVAHDLFVHHYGSRTFAGNAIDAEGLLEENARRFADKWGDAAPLGRRVALQPFTVRPGTDSENGRTEKPGFLPRVDAEERGSLSDFTMGGTDTRSSAAIRDKNRSAAKISRLRADYHRIPGATGCPQPVPDGPRRFPTG